jgi:hypothetical protein
MIRIIPLPGSRRARAAFSPVLWYVFASQRIDIGTKEGERRQDQWVPIEGVTGVQITGG